MIDPKILADQARQAQAERRDQTVDFQTLGKKDSPFGPLKDDPPPPPKEPVIQDNDPS